MLLRVIATIVAGYLLGCISTGMLVGKLVANVDIRTKGSGNAGATNILRTLGWAPSLLTFAGDAVKALLACWVGSLIFRGLPEWEAGLGPRIAGIACILGHNWPVFFGFRGGKGVSSSFGVLLYTSPLTALCALAVFIAVTAITKTVSIASISAGLMNAILAVAIYWGNWVYMAFGLAITALLILCHRSNIARLRARNENSLDFAKISKISHGGK